MNQPWVYMCSHPESPSHLPPHPIPLGCPRAPTLDALLHASNLHWSSVLHMVIYMFQCCSHKPSHPPLLPLSPKFCSLRLCLFCCPAFCIKLALVICFTYGNICVSMLFSQTIPPSSSPTESKSMFLTSVSLLLSRI